MRTIAILVGLLFARRRDCQCALATGIGHSEISLFSGGIYGLS
jgi:hypothetical protein